MRFSRRFAPVRARTIIHPCRPIIQASSPVITRHGERFVFVLFRAAARAERQVRGKLPPRFAPNNPSCLWLIPTIIIDDYAARGWKADRHCDEYKYAPFNFSSRKETRRGSRYFFDSREIVCEIHGSGRTRSRGTWSLVGVIAACASIDTRKSLKIAPP